MKTQESDDEFKSDSDVEQIVFEEKNAHAKLSDNEELPN